jgi:FMN-dependent NADH-azoreductase
MKLLHVDSSILGAYSVTRVLTAAIVEHEKKLHPGLEIVTRDLIEDTLYHLAPRHLAVLQGGTTTNENLIADLALGAAVMDEVIAADIIVIGAPMYNFGIPSQLKAWIDRIVVAGKTFRYTNTGTVESLLPKGKKVIIASSTGGAYGPQSPAALLEHQVSYLKGTLAFIGLTDVTVIGAEGIALGPEAREAALKAALAEVAKLAA